MRRAVILLATVAVAMVVGGGVALAATIRCDGGNCVGTSRPDSMFGTDRHDAMFARDGGDFVSGRGRADNLSGEDGHDHVLGGWGDDWVKGGAHDDEVEGGLGNDRITGGPGDNVIRAADGMRDHIICGDDSWNLIFYDPRLDRFSNCVFFETSVRDRGSSKSSVSVVGVGGSSRIGFGQGSLLRGLRVLPFFHGR